ncbi:unnamed protein product [Sphenostylis stenocarpa]|uniref:Uncharacterized protein n=1 Tax=Sphenostylis stenocarpa TaxID=92480 RepID=A0AA86S832_9FABA|nr:unnamed protein product [Sphenostylis stenocarpa]
MLSCGFAMYEVVCISFRDNLDIKGRDIQVIPSMDWVSFLHHKNQIHFGKPSIDNHSKHTLRK